MTRAVAAAYGAKTSDTPRSSRDAGSCDRRSSYAHLREARSCANRRAPSERSRRARDPRTSRRSPRPLRRRSRRGLLLARGPAPPSVARAPAPRAARGPVRAALPADRLARRRRRLPLRGAACASPTNPTAPLVAPGRLPARGRALRPDPRDRPAGARARSPRCSARRRRAAARASAINLSALSVTDPAMLAHIERWLARTSVDPARLVIEITETAAISDMDRARAFCAGAARARLRGRAR